MSLRRKDLQPSLFGRDEAPRVMMSARQMVDLAALVDALLREIATALASGGVSDEQDHG
jgi:hypothetical protein